MNRQIKRVLAGMLSLLLLFNTLSLDVRAEELGNDVEICDVSGNEEYTPIEEDDVSASEVVVPEEDEVIPEEEEEPVLDVSSNEEIEELLEEVSKDDLSRVFYRSLSKDEKALKAGAIGDIAGLRRAVSGKDYEADEVFALAESEEEAEEIRIGYEKATGYKVTLKSFNYGVAVFNIAGEPKESLSDNFKSMNSVMCLASVGASEENNLPAVFPNYHRYADTHNYQDITDYEDGFKDPFIKFNINADNADYYQWYHEMINDKFVWSAMNSYILEPSTLEDIFVLVLDTGVNRGHSDLFYGIKAVKNFIAEEPDSDGDDEQGHGTNVCGIIGSDANSKGGRGVAAGVSMISGRVLNSRGEGDDSAILAALRWAISNEGKNYNIKVINMSLGSSWADAAYYTVLSEVRSAGILVVAAAGNENTGTNHYPAAYPDVLSVAALNSDYKRSSFSNYGNTVDIAAPGGERTGQKDFNSGLKDLREELLWTTGASGYRGSIDYCGDVYCGMCGTSQATPVVSAAAAYVFAYCPGATPAMVEYTLKESAKKIKTDKAVGAGCVDIAAALGIDTDVAAPTPSKPSGTVLSRTDYVQLNNSGGQFRQDEVIYYTIDGTTPVPFKESEAGSSSTKLYEGSVRFDTMTGKITVKAVTYLYGKVSPVATFTYTFEEEAPTVMISSTGDHKVALGKKLTLKASVVPTTKKKQSFVWTSSDTTKATVSSSGVVTAKAITDFGEHITIRASLAENPEIYGEYSVVITKPATEIVVRDKDGVPSDSITMCSGDDLQLNSVVYPLEASQAVKYTSANTKIATIDRTVDGSGNYTYFLHAVKSGTAKITATAMDGTGVKKTITLKVVTPISALTIKSASGFDAVAEGMTINLTAIYNDGNSVPDKDKNKITWRITGGGTCASVNDKGQLTAKVTGEAATGACHILVQATATNTVTNTEVKSNELDIKVYCPISKFVYNMDYNTIYSDSGFYGNLMDYVWPVSEGENTSYYVSPGFKYKSSNPKAVSIDENGHFVFLKNGKATLTMTATDGSGKKASYYCHVIDWDEGFGYINHSGTNVLYPGKSISLKIAYSGKSKLREYFSCFLDDKDNVWLSSTYYASISGDKIKAKTTMKNVTPGYTEDVHLVGPSYDDYGYFAGYASCACETLEYYPAGTSKISLNETSKTMDIGECFALSATTEPANACQKYYAFTSSNTKVCKVCDDGSVFAVGNGSARITVTAGDGSKKTAVCNVTVSKPVTGVAVDFPNNGYLAVNKTVQAVATISPSDAGNKNVVWSLVDPADSEYVNLDAKTGKVTAKKAGKEVFVRATSKDNSEIYAQKSIKITEKTAINVSAASWNLYPGHSETDDVTCYSLFSGEQIANNITVASSNASIVKATYDAATKKLQYTPLKAGKAKVTLTAADGSGVKKVINITVMNPVTEMTVTPKNGQSALVFGKSLQFTATANKNATNKTVTWSVGGPGEELVSISAKGVLTINKGVTKEQIKPASEDRRLSVVVAATPKYGNTGAVYSERIYLYADSADSVSVCDEWANPVKSGTGITLGVKKVGEYKKWEYYTAHGIGKAGAEGQDVCPNVIISSSNSKVANVFFEKGAIYIEAYSKGKATITFAAADGSGKKATINVMVVEPVTKITVISKDGRTVMAGGTSLQLAANVNEGAGNKAVTWGIKEGLTNVRESSDAIKAIASVDAKGLLRIDNDKLEALCNEGEETHNYMVFPVYIDVEAVSKDSKSQVTDTLRISVYRNVDEICVVWGEENKTSPIQVNVGGQITLSFSSIYDERTDSWPGYNHYVVTYTKGCGTMLYVDSGANDNTELVFIATNPGKVTVTVKALDGTNHKWTYEINVSN